MQKHEECRNDLAHDGVLPTLLFAALGAMTWAVRGCSGFGAMNGCIFAGVTWGTAWWFIARDPSSRQTRPYASAWIILALTLGIGFSGNRGWMQWPSFFAGHLQTNTPAGRFVPISRTYGFIWLFLAGVPWAGLGACLLAWCGTHRRAGMGDWVLRVLCGIGLAWGARLFFENFPDICLPLHRSLAVQYADLKANPNLRRLMNDNRAALTHLGWYLGFLTAEALRRDWRNVALILTVGLLNGFGWAACQNWHWAAGLWPDFKFNWWRCWESSGGICIGIAYGVAFYLVNRPIRAGQVDQGAAGAPAGSPNAERWAAYAGLVLGLGLSVRNGLKGWANIYLGNEPYWDGLLWKTVGPLLLTALIGVTLWVWARPLPKRVPENVFPRAYGLVWLMLITQNVIAQLVTGPWTNWNEAAFSIYYGLLFLLTAVILFHYHVLKRQLALAVACQPAIGTAPVDAPVRL
jgi:hypothetical protein